MAEDDSTSKEELRRAMAAKLEAEAVKLAAEAEKAKAEAAKARAEEESTRANIELTRRDHLARIEPLEIDAEKARRKFEEERAADKYHHIFNFGTEVSDGSVRACIEQLTIWHRLDLKCDIEIVFDSPGGSVLAGFALFDYIKDLEREGHYVTTVARGVAASMAGILLQAGNKRVMGAEASVLIHEISTMAIGKIGEIEDTVEFVKKLQKKAVDIFMERCDGKISRRTFEKRWRRKDWWLMAEDCLKFGFVDEVRH